MLSNDTRAPAVAHPENVQISANGSVHKIRIHRDLVKSFGAPLKGGFGYVSTETNIRIRVKSYRARPNLSWRTNPLRPSCA